MRHARGPQRLLLLFRSTCLRAGLKAMARAATRRLPRQRRPLWRCPRCRRRFANRNQPHACGRHDLAAHFRGKTRLARQLFNAFVAAVRRCGPVTIVPEKSRIAFQTRMSFAAVMIRSTRLVGHLVLAVRFERPCFHRIDSLSPRNHVHHFRIQQPGELDPEFQQLLQAAYRVGWQEHLARLD